MDSYAILERNLKAQQARQQDEGAGYSWALGAIPTLPESGLDRLSSALSQLSSNYGTDVGDYLSAYGASAAGVGCDGSYGGWSLQSKRSPALSRRMSRDSLESIDTELDISGF